MTRHTVWGSLARLALATLPVFAAACDPDAPADGGVDAAVDGGGVDGGPGDAGGPDGGADAGPVPVPSLSFEPIALEGEPAAVTDFAFVPGTPDEILLTELAGTVRHYRLEDDEAELLGSFSIDTVLDAECGLISLAFDPGWEDNRFVYLGHCTSPQASRVTRIALRPGAYDEAWATAQLVVEVEEPDAPAGWHNVGAMGFEDGDVLWVLFGDKTEADHARDLDRLNGKLLRIVPNRTPGEGGYEPAPGNPFVDEDGDPAVYASGLRSPWRGTLDPFGRWWIGDVGNHDFEEVNLVDGPGRDFGWPGSEGPCDDDCAAVTDPVRYYSHDSDDAIFFDDPDLVPSESRAVWVGPVYSGRHGDRYDGRLTHRLLWGDFAMGFVRVLEVLPDGSVRADANVGHLEAAAAWREGPDGWIYAASFGGIDPSDPAPGRLYRAELE